MSFGRSRARKVAGDKPQATFVDVAGVDEGNQGLTEVVEFVKYATTMAVVEGPEQGPGASASATGWAPHGR